MVPFKRWRRLSRSSVETSTTETFSDPVCLIDVRRFISHLPRCDVCILAAAILNIRETGIQGSALVTLGIPFEGVGAWLFVL